MIRAFDIKQARLAALDPGSGWLQPALWIDAEAPEAEEERQIEALTGLDLPTREDMQEIELSSRLYSDAAAFFMTATIAAKADGDDPDMQPVTFILSDARLITIRYHEPYAFRVLLARAQKGAVAVKAADDLLVTLLEAVVDRKADILERAGREIDALSRDVFRHSKDRPGGKQDFREILAQIGRKGDLVSKIRDSLATLERLAGFLYQIGLTRNFEKALRERVKTLSRDIRSISDHAGFLAQKITFLLDATLGLINIEQSNIIKIFSVVAFVMLPPTLIASIYGMNFEHMPELGWRHGYPLALGAMLVSAITPYLYFKYRGWLR